MFSHRIRKTSVALAVAASVVGTGVLTAAAQGTPATPTAPTTSDSQTQPSQPPQGRGHGFFGRGMMMGLDFGPDGNLADSPIITAVADALKLDAATLVSDLQSGKSITDLAAAQGVELQTVYDAVIAKFKQLFDAEVSTGFLTQEQADTRLQTLTDNIASFPLFAVVQFPNPADMQGQGFGGPNGPQGGFGPGMNGNDQWGNHRFRGRGPWGNPQNPPINPDAPQDGQVAPEATQTANA